MFKQGDIIKVDLGTIVGHEEAGYRPCLCLSNHLVYQYSHVVIIAPISHTARNYPLYVKLDEQYTNGKILLDQIRVIDTKAQECHFVETISRDKLSEVLEIAKMIFDLDRV